MRRTPITIGRNGERSQWYSAAETAVLVRATLKEHWPAQRFSVTSSEYSMGASITVRWVEGPSSADVEAQVEHFGTATFDSSIDLQGHKPAEFVNGVRVQYASDWIHCYRMTAAEDATQREFARIRKERQKARRERSLLRNAWTRC